VLSARPIRKRVVRRIYVRRGVLRAWVWLAFGLLDRLLDLVGEFYADRLELLLGDTGREEIGEGALHRVFGAPFVDFLLRAVAAVVVVARVRLVAVALELDKARALSRALVICRDLRPFVAIQHAHPVGDMTRHRVRRALGG